VRIMWKAVFILLLVHTYSSAVCQGDTPNWKNSQGYTCDNYANNQLCAKCGPGEYWDAEIYGELSPLIENCCESCGCEVENDGTAVKECKGIDKKPCIFPFEHWGWTYTDKCALSKEQIPAFECPTSVDENGVFKYSYCDMRVCEGKAQVFELNNICRSIPGESANSCKACTSTYNCGFHPIAKRCWAMIFINEKSPETAKDYITESGKCPSATQEAVGSSILGAENNSMTNYIMLAMVICVFGYLGYYVGNKNDDKFAYEELAKDQKIELTNYQQE